MTRSGFNSAISPSLAVLKPLTRGFGAASSGGVKKAVIPTTRSHAPIRQSQSADSADKQTMRSGRTLMPIRRVVAICKAQGREISNHTDLKDNTMDEESPH